MKDLFKYVYSFRIENKSPGIGKYSIACEKENQTGTYFVSSFQSSPGKTFFKKTRSTIDILS